MLSSLVLTTFLLGQAWSPAEVGAPVDPGFVAAAPPVESELIGYAPQGNPPLPAPPGPAGDFVTRKEFQAELKKSGWTKGDFKIVPYGIIWGNMAYDTQRSRIGDYCVFIESPTLHHNEDAFSVDAKSTRVGLDLLGPGVEWLGDGKVYGRFEIDGQGQFVYRNRSGILVRHAYIEVKNECYRLLVGQFWDVISPLYNPTLNYTAGAAVGNIGFRRAQFRAERFLNFSDTFLVTLQGSLNANIVSDFLTDSTVSADPGPFPDVQSRVAFTFGEHKLPTDRPIVFGVGGHFGEQNFDFRRSPADLNVDPHTWSVNADLLLPITQKLTAQAEFFTGSNLSNYMGGILQGVDAVTHRGIRATGGWAELIYDWRPDLHSHVGYSIDDPLDSDLATPASKTRNQTLFTILFWDVNKALQLGFEVDVWRTGYKGLPAGEANRFEFAVKYRF